MNSPLFFTLTAGGYSVCVRVPLAEGFHYSLHLSTLESKCQYPKTI